ncbi:MAG: mandelate racemase [Ectothiorhodospiraceae bacterium]|nr:mandelate racemase [Chromatiales bacterium]MCP5154719.1 mandelate racemase [Ectothiorhodospiraceae bacterium]
MLGSESAAAALTVRSVTTRAVLLPLDRPIATRVILIERVPLLLVDLHTEEGVTGRSYLFGFDPASTARMAEMVHHAVDIVRGEAVAPVALGKRLARATTLLGHQGLTRIAFSAIDMCAWDALARALDVPLVRLLGGEPGRVRAYNSNGLGLSDPHALGEEAAELVEEGGFEAIKIRLGRARADDDLAAIRSVRRAVGDDIILPSDYNQGLTVMDAVARGRALDDEGLHWIEEPVVHDDLAGNAKVAREIATPVQIGENFYLPSTVAEAVAIGACDYLMLDLGRIGGVTGWMQSAAIAAAGGIELSTHLFPEFSCHLLPVTPTAHWLEYMSWADPILAEPLEVRGGYVEIPSRPGAGIDWDEDAVAAYALDL